MSQKMIKIMVFVMIGIMVLTSLLSGISMMF
ncbi:stressosome-associated protein Prli42 [Bacillus sonorensis]|nr:MULTISPECIES: stressosome-associated protein Prli42 [Bacillus]MCF7617891.1 stressosome-associated protein Prli42 [Bacillus sonorensis]MCY7856611.1 stressosome-associated protein Prli42 [Bacillus sonorensis]MCY8024170.1 stressosome-associated protein Prli42 [Bacillus sonorensis]MCY8034683.1 stressosome-associated protein Prli42 [Bacillus sonorensis]MCY8087877.1 stressosome-associated protein Prli42 [Bacillus sonorensis]